MVRLVTLKKKISGSMLPYVEKEKEKEKEKLLLQVGSILEGGFRFCEFYILDLRTDHVSDCPSVLFANYPYNARVALGSVIYIVGSPKLDMIESNLEPPNSIPNHQKGLFHKGISYLDLNASDSERGWKEIPCVDKHLRIILSVVGIAGKLYLFHSTINKSEAINVFDTISNKWEELFPPSQADFFEIPHNKCALVDHENNRIIVSFPSIKSVFAYYPSDNRWELVLDSFPKWSSRVVFAQGLIFYYLASDPKMVDAYHVANKQFLNVVLTCEVADGWGYHSDDMLYLGNGIMCLASEFIPPPDEPSDTTRICIAKFKFELPSDRPGVLLVTPLADADQTYTLATSCSTETFFPTVSFCPV